MSEEKADYNPSDGMMNLKGKAYLPVAARIVWFRNDYPEGTIETIIREIDHERGFAMFTAEVCTGQGGRATATGSETVKDFGDYIEKAETKAVGRALGYLGYGTAAAGFEEGKRIVDAPQDFRQSAAKPAPRSAERPQERPNPPAPVGVPIDMVLATLRDMDEARDPFAEIKQYASEHLARFDPATQERIKAKVKAIADGRRASAPAPLSVAG